MFKKKKKKAKIPYLTQKKLYLTKILKKKKKVNRVSKATLSVFFGIKLKKKKIYPL